MTATRALVVTADDCGRESESTDAILGLVDAGRVTATTLIVVARESARAAAELRRRGVTPRVHVTLTSERDCRPWAPLSSRVPSLTDQRGFLRTDPEELAERGSTLEVEREMSAQWQWLVSHGFTPRGLDSHCGTLYGLHGERWLPTVIAFCCSRELSFRLPRELRSHVGAARASQPDVLRRHARAVEVCDLLGVHLPQAIATNRLPAESLGDYDGLRAHYVELLRALPDRGTSELFVHPAPFGAPGVSRSHPLRAWELRLLSDAEFWRAIAREGFDLVDRW